MRYGFDAATAARPIPLLPAGVVPPPELALPVALLRRPSARLASGLRAPSRAIPVAPVAAPADHDQAPASGANEHPV